MNAETIANQARKSISEFCYTECKSYCCRKRYLILEKDEVDVVTQQGREPLLMTKRLKALPNGSFSLYLEGGCPSLKDNKCSIHTHKKRPKTCSDFPVYIKGDVAFFSPRCTAVKQGMMYPFQRRLQKKGLRIVDENPFTNVEFFTLR